MEGKTACTGLSGVFVAVEAQARGHRIPALTEAGRLPCKRSLFICHFHPSSSYTYPGGSRRGRRRMCEISPKEPQLRSCGNELNQKRITIQDVNPDINSGSRQLDVILCTAEVRGNQFHQNSLQKCFPSVHPKGVSMHKAVFSHNNMFLQPLNKLHQSLLYLFILLLFSQGVCCHFSWEPKPMGLGGNRRLNHHGGEHLALPAQGDQMLDLLVRKLSRW